MTTIRGWQALSAASGKAMRTLRRLHAEGALVGSKGDDGVWTFATADLDALAAGSKPIVDPIATPSTAPIPPVAGITASNSTSSAIAPGSAPIGVIAPFLLAAVSRRDSAIAACAGSAAAGADSDDDQDDEGPWHEPPFWESATYPSGEPYVDVATGVICYRPAPAASAGTHPPGTVAAQVTDLQRQLAQAQAQLAQVCAERDRYRIAWRRERVGGIANGIGFEALMSGALPGAALAARDAAGSAADGLPTAQLADEAGYALAVGRAAGMAAAQQMGAAIEWQEAGVTRHDGDDLTRARRRRSRRY